MNTNTTIERTISGNVILYSFGQPVAAYVQGRGYVKTAGNHSIDTISHIQSFVRDVDIVEQSYLDDIAKEEKDDSIAKQMERMRQGYDR